jgi:hypothetical protein
MENMDQPEGSYISTSSVSTNRATYVLRWALMRRLAIAALLMLSVMVAGASRIELSSKDRKGFAALSAKLSETPGYFDSDNLISNETSYLHVIHKLREIGVKGGVYVGVGPDQSYTYIAEIRPKMAIMIDIRRDCLLQHLLYKALFENSRNRVEYLSLFFGKPFPKGGNWEQKGIKELVDYIDNTPTDAKLGEKTLSDLKRDIQKYGFQLSDTDMRTIEQIYRAFLNAGLDIRYSSHHRPPRSIYPTYRELLLERDLDGQMQNYFNSEDKFQFLKKLHDQDMIVPVTGDLSGPQALKSVGKYVEDMKEKISAFYVSNVEFYLLRQGSYEKFIENVKSLPIDNRSVMIRSYFNYYAPKHPQAEGDHFSTQLLQKVTDLIKQCSEGDCESYMDIVTKNSIPLK